MKRFTLPVAYTSYSVVPVVKLSDYGECRFDERLIQIRQQAHVDAMRFVLWHEFFHALFHELGYMNLRDDESLVDNLALSIMRVRAEVPTL